MNYEEAINYIHDTQKFGSKLGLDNIGLLLDLMGNPQDKLKYVHVAGTNGKGSTVAFISSILMQSGYNVGIFTSPFIQRFSERIKINETEIANDDLAKLTSFVRSKVDIMLEQNKNHPTEFEIITAMAFQYFYEKKCDVVVLEVGLGGRFDSTNIIKTPDLAVVTTISYDHMDRLGDTLQKIAFEKAGVIKPAGDVVIYPQIPEVEDVFRSVCKHVGANAKFVNFENLKPLEFTTDGQTFDFNEYKSLQISLLGEFQTRNAAVSVIAAEKLVVKGYNITQATIRQGLFNAKWPGRFEIINKNPIVIVDAAHNSECAIELRKTLYKYFPNNKLSLIIGVLSDKDYRAMIEAVVPGCHRVITVTPKSQRALPAEELAEAVKEFCGDVRVCDSIDEAVKLSIKLSKPDEIICAFGSLYYIGAVREVFGL